MINWTKETNYETGHAYMRTWKYSDGIRKVAKYNGCSLVWKSNNNKTEIKIDTINATPSTIVDGLASIEDVEKHLFEIKTERLSIGDYKVVLRYIIDNHKNFIDYHKANGKTEIEAIKEVYFTLKSLDSFKYDLFKILKNIAKVTISMELFEIKINEKLLGV